MKRKGIAKVFRNGRSQAVRLPREFRFEGEQIRVHRVRDGVLLEPLPADCRRRSAERDRYGAEPFPERRRRPGSLKGKFRVGPGFFEPLAPEE